MVRCDKCCEVFHESDCKSVKKLLCFIDGKPEYETLTCCPHCGCEDLFCVEPCRICGGYEGMDEMTDICPSCKKACSDKFKAFRDSLTENEFEYFMDSLEELV